jgi:hypothetical protein
MLRAEGDLDVTDPAILYLSKAAESLAGAEAEYENQRYNNCAIVVTTLAFRPQLQRFFATRFDPEARKVNGVTTLSGRSLQGA